MINDKQTYSHDWILYQIIRSQDDPFQILS